MNDYTLRDRKNYGDTDITKTVYPEFAKSSKCVVIYCTATTTRHSSESETSTAPKQSAEVSTS